MNIHLYTNVIKRNVLLIIPSIKSSYSNIIMHMSDYQAILYLIHHIRRIMQIRRLLGPEVTVKLVTYVDLQQTRLL